MLNVVTDTYNEPNMMIMLSAALTKVTHLCSLTKFIMIRIFNWGTFPNRKQPGMICCSDPHTHSGY